MTHLLSPQPIYSPPFQKHPLAADAYVSCGEGWTTLLQCFLACVSVLVSQEDVAVDSSETRTLSDSPSEPTFSLLEAKEKWGGLRLDYTQIASTNLDPLVEMAELLSERLCEQCGAPGTVRSGSWLQSLCTHHAAEAGELVNVHENALLPVHKQPKLQGPSGHDGVVPEGWVPLFEMLCVYLDGQLDRVHNWRKSGAPLDTVIDPHTEFKIVQVKPKFGRLVVYFESPIPHMQHCARLAIMLVTEMSYYTCEVCGQPGSWRTPQEGGPKFSYVRTLCDHHYEQHIT
jgi:hypothetical protein